MSNLHRSFSKLFWEIYEHCVLHPEYKLHCSLKESETWQRRLKMEKSFWSKPHQENSLTLIHLKLQFKYSLEDEALIITFVNRTPVKCLRKYKKL